MPYQIVNRYGVVIVDYLFGSPKEADNYIEAKLGGSRYLTICKVSGQRNLKNFFEV